MTKTVLRISMGETRAREIVRLVSDPCPGPKEGQAGLASLYAMMTDMVSHGNLIVSSNPCPGTLSIVHQNGCWVVESISEISV